MCEATRDLADKTGDDRYQAVDKEQQEAFQPRTQGFPLLDMFIDMRRREKYFLPQPSYQKGETPGYGVVLLES